MADDPSRRPARVPIHPIIRRNTLLLSANQAMIEAATLSTVMIVGLSILLTTGSAGLAGFASSLVLGGRVFTVYHAGILMDRLGRKKVLYLGASLALIAIGIMIAALILDSAVLLWLGAFLIGVGLGIQGLNRVAVMDMYPLNLRGEGIGLYLTASVIGSLLSTGLTTLVWLFGLSKTDTYIVMLLIAATITIIGMVFIVLIKPDTRKIGQDLKTYFPDHSSLVTSCSGDDMERLEKSRKYPMQAGFISSALAWGVMVMDMSLVSVILARYGYELSLISLAITIHVFGMFVLSIPIGRLADRWGRRPVIATGGLILLTGALIMPLTDNYVFIVLGVFLVGLGWCGANVGTTALICDLTPLAKRGKILGLNDMVTGAASIILPLAGSMIFSLWGSLAFGLIGLAFSLPIFLILLVRERSPGRYV